MLIPLVAVLLSACGADDGSAASTAREAGRADAADAALPMPAGAAGRGVTGMPPTRESAPVPDPAPAVLTPEPPIDPASLPPADDTAAAAGTSTAPNDGAVPVAAPADGEPTVADAVAALRDYYAAINAGSFSHAYALWSDHGRASGQTPEQFAAGFAQTRSVSVQIGPPGRLEAAAGSRFLQLPVTLTAIQRDGRERHYAGSYTLRRAVVDGATPEQRAWRIASAELGEIGG